MADIKRTYTIPLRRGYANTPRHRRTHKAVRVLKEFLVKHMKSDDVKIGKNLNEHLWQNGIRNPPSKVKVVATKDKEGLVRVELEGKDYVDFKLQDKTETNQTFKEKLQNTVAQAKGDKKEDAAEEKTEAKSEAKAPAKKAAPKKEEAPKAEAKAEKPAAKEAKTE